LIVTDKLIVCVATCGSFLGKEANPNIPTNPKEIAEEVYRSWNEGASMAHIHARDEEGMATTNPEVFGEIARLVREKGCDIVLEFSTSPGREEGANVEDGFRVLEANPELVSFNVGIGVFMRAGKEQWFNRFFSVVTHGSVLRIIYITVEVFSPRATPSSSPE